MEKIAQALALDRPHLEQLGPDLYLHGPVRRA